MNNSKKISVNAISNVAAMVVRLAIVFVMTPVYVAFLGNYDYGIWELAFAIFGYLGLLDGGMRQGVIVYTAKYAARKDIRSLRGVYSTSLTLLALVGILAASIWLLVASHYLPTEVPGGDGNKYRIFIFLIAFQCMVTFPSLVSQSMLDGQQAYLAKNIVASCLSILSAIIVYSVISAENALLVLAFMASVMATVRFGVFEYMIRKKSRQTRIRWGRIDWGIARSLSNFSFKSFVQGSAAQIEMGAPVILIASISGPAAIIFYAIPNALFNQAQGIVWSIAEVFVPEFRNIRESGDRQAERELHRFASKVLVAISALLISGVAAIGPTFVDHWVGRDYGSQNSTLIVLLAVYFGLALLNPFVVKYLTAINQHGVLAVVRPIKVVILIPLAIWLTSGYGIEGLATSLIVMEIVTFPVLLFLTCRNLGITVGNYVAHCILPSLLPVISLGFIGTTMLDIIAPSNLIEVLAVAAISGTAFVGVSVFTVLRPNERKRLMAIVKK